MDDFLKKILDTVQNWIAQCPYKIDWDTLEVWTSEWSSCDDVSKFVIDIEVESFGIDMWGNDGWMFGDRFDIWESLWYEGIEEKIKQEILKNVQ